MCKYGADCIFSDDPEVLARAKAAISKTKGKGKGKEEHPPQSDA